MSVDVLVVDDDADLRGPLADLLRDEGYVVEVLAGTDDFHDSLESMQPKLVLLDLTLPGTDLRQVLKAARTDHLTEGRTIFALSGLDDASQQAEDLGLDGAVRKPFDIQELLTLIASVCRSPPPEVANDQHSIA
jgi:DNA-binding response OmpR family regulator